MAEDDKQDAVIRSGEDGFPVMFAARAPGQVATQQNSGVTILRGAASGNPNADTGSGRFTSKGKGKTATVQGNDVVVTQQTRALPQGVTPEQWTKRQDIIRTAARTLQQLDPAKAKAFLNAHPQVDAAQVNVDLFVRDVRSAQIDDFVDILNQQLKTGQVSIRAGKRFIKSVFRGLTADEATSVTKRLEGQGWSTEDIKSKVVAKFPEGSDVRTQLDQLYGEPKAKEKQQ